MKITGKEWNDFYNNLDDDMFFIEYDIKINDKSFISDDSELPETVYDTDIIEIVSLYLMNDSDDIYTEKDFFKIKDTEIFTIEMDKKYKEDLDNFLSSLKGKILN